MIQKLSAEIHFKASSHTIFYTKLNVWPTAKIAERRAGRCALRHALLFPTKHDGDYFSFL